MVYDPEDPSEPRPGLAQQKGRAGAQREPIDEYRGSFSCKGHIDLGLGFSV